MSFRAKNLTWALVAVVPLLIYAIFLPKTTPWVFIPLVSLPVGFLGQVWTHKKAQEAAMAEREELEKVETQRLFKANLHKGTMLSLIHSLTVIGEQKAADFLQRCLLITFLAIIPSIASAQFYLQPSYEYKLNYPAGWSYSTEVGVTGNINKLFIGASLDWTVYSDADVKTQHLLFEMLTFGIIPPNPTTGIYPYVSVSLGHLDKLNNYEEGFGGSIQIGINAAISDHIVFFTQYRYFEFREAHLLEQLLQTGMVWIP